MGLPTVPQVAKGVVMVAISLVIINALRPVLPASVKSAMGIA